MSPFSNLRQQAANRKPIDPALYELTIDSCGPNSEELVGGAEDVPVGDGFAIDMTIKNLDTRDRRFQIELTIRSSSDNTNTHDLASSDVPKLAPGEAITISRTGWVTEAFRDGFTCETEVWPSLTEFVEESALPPDA